LFFLASKAIGTALAPSSGTVTVAGKVTKLSVFCHLGLFWRPDMIFCKDKVAQKKWQHLGLPLA
jgi:hypothetical protein